MKTTHIQQQKKSSQSTANNPEGARQASVKEILQKYKDKSIGTISPVLPEEDELLQGKSETTQPKKISEEDEDFFPLQQKTENKTGLPDNLKAGIENFSGYSMDDVLVHYNSNKPAQLNALAYAQGSEIHIAPGQEKHLPHEAWHVVQQKQGRVQSTKQIQNIKINDNESLENEADTMGERSSQNQQLLKQNKSGSKSQTTLLKKINSYKQIIQGQFYIRGLKKSAVDNDHAFLNRMQTEAGNPLIFVRHFKGLLSSVTRYNPGQKYYYSPVGYIIDINDAEKILANFATDGSTGDLQQNHLTYQYGYAAKTIPELQANIDTEQNDTTKKKMMLAKLIKEYQVIGNEADKKAHATKMLKLFYTIPGVVNNPLGEGLNPQGLSEAEVPYKTQTSSDDLKYTESKIAIEPIDLVAAYYNDNEAETSVRSEWSKEEGSYKPHAETIKGKYGLSSIKKINEAGNLIDD